MKHIIVDNVTYFNNNRTKLFMRLERSIKKKHVKKILRVFLNDFREEIYNVNTS